MQHCQFSKYPAGDTDLLQGEIGKKGVFDLFTLVILFQFRKCSGIINFKEVSSVTPILQIGGLYPSL
jgi:hypothetical protein